MRGTWPGLPKRNCAYDKIVTKTNKGAEGRRDTLLATSLLPVLFSPRV